MTLHRSYPQRLGGTRQSILKLRWIAVLALALALIVAAFSLGPFARSQTRKLLDGLKGMKAEFSDVHVSLFPLRYRITHLKIREEKPKTKEPLFYADEIAVTVRWSRLLTGHLAGTVATQRAKLVLHQPPEGSQVRLPPIEEVVPFPALLERAQGSAAARCSTSGCARRSSLRCGSMTSSPPWKTSAPALTWSKV